jgi:hypothetical protein
MSEEYVRVTLATKAHSLRENCLRETRDMFKTQNLAVLGVISYREDRLRVGYLTTV